MLAYFLTLTGMRIRGIAFGAIWGCGLLTAIGLSTASAASPVISAEDLSGQLDGDQTLVVLDARRAEVFAKGHIAGARPVDVDQWLKKSLGRGGLQDQQFWSAAGSELGLSAADHVVVVGDSLPNTARVWWILKYLGIEHVQVLDGGLGAWAAAGNSMTTDATEFAATEFVADLQSSRLALLRDVHEQGDEAETCKVLDNRSEAEFTGRRGVGSRTGHIPDAVHLEWTKFVRKDGKFLSVDEIKKLMQQFDVEKGTPVVAHCQTGGRSAVAVLALELAGFDDVKNYYRGWSEYSEALTAPVAR